MQTKPKPRGAVKKKTAQLIAVWVPTEMSTAIDKAVQLFDTDRSKFVREAIREHTRRKLTAVA